MANAFSAKSTVVNGRTLVLDAAPPSAMSLASLVVTGDVAIEWEIYLDKDISTLAMGAVSLSDNSSGGTILNNTTVFVRVTAIDADGKESPPSVSVSKKVGSSGNAHRVTATWSAVVGAISYNIYTSTKSNQENLFLAGAVSPQSITVQPLDIPLSVPTTPDIHLIAAVGVHSIPVIGVPLSARIVVYAKASTGGISTISCLAQ